MSTGKFLLSGCSTLIVGAIILLFLPKSEEERISHPESSSSESPDTAPMTAPATNVSSRSFRDCVNRIGKLCANHGSENCMWPNNDCEFRHLGIHPNILEATNNKTIVFRGDSTMRDVFGLWSHTCCPADPEITKKMSNMTYRSLIPRHNDEKQLKSFFKFDYLYEHLEEKLPLVPPNVDVVVISLGVYESRVMPTNISNATIQRYAQNVVDSVCNVHKAKLGLFLAGGLECKTMKRHAVASTRAMGRQCPQSSKSWRIINTAVRDYIQKVHQHKESHCELHYLPSLKCSVTGRKVCTVDGIHPRARFAKSKLELILNVVDLFFRTNL
eukprot:PhF_6_TR35720/c0_g1_i1/m.51861